MKENLGQFHKFDHRALHYCCVCCY